MNGYLKCGIVNLVSVNRPAKKYCFHVLCLIEYLLAALLIAKCRERNFYMYPRNMSWGTAIPTIYIYAERSLRCALYG